MERSERVVRVGTIRIMDGARILSDGDTASRDVSRRIEQRIRGYTQSAGFEGCIESRIRGGEVCVTRTRTAARVSLERIRLRKLGSHLVNPRVD